MKKSKNENKNIPVTHNLKNLLLKFTSEEDTSQTKTIKAWLLKGCVNRPKGNRSLTAGVREKQELLGRNPQSDPNHLTVSTTLRTCSRALLENTRLI